MMQLQFDYTWKRLSRKLSIFWKHRRPHYRTLFLSPSRSRSTVAPPPLLPLLLFLGRASKTLDIPRGYFLNLICRRYASRTKGFLGRGWRLRSNIISLLVDIDRSKMQGGAHRIISVSRRRGGPHTTALRSVPHLLSAIDQKREKRRGSYIRGISNRGEDGSAREFEAESRALC